MNILSTIPLNAFFATTLLFISAMIPYIPAIMICGVMLLAYSLLTDVLHWKNRRSHSHEATNIPPVSLYLVIAALIYALISVFVGSYIFFSLEAFSFSYGKLLPVDGLQSCSGTPISNKEAAYEPIKKNAGFAAALLFTVGTVLLVALAVTRLKTGISRSVRAGLMVSLLLCGHGGTMAVADWLSNRCL